MRVYIGDPPKFLFCISAWEADDRILRGEARLVKISKRRRGLVIISPAKHNEHTLAAQLSEWQQAISDEHPELWLINGGRATLEQVEGLPVVGQAIKAFSNGGAVFKPRALRRGPVIDKLIAGVAAGELAA